MHEENWVRLFIDMAATQKNPYDNMKIHNITKHYADQRINFNKLFCTGHEKK